MATKDSEKSIELYKVVLFILIIVVIVVIVVNIKNKKREEIYKTNGDEVTQVSVSPSKTAKPIKLKFETSKADENQELDTDASVGESIRFKEFYIIPQEVTDEKIVFKFDSSSILREFDKTSQLYVKKDLYTINKGETIKFSDGIVNQDIYTITY